MSNARTEHIYNKVFLCPVHLCNQIIEKNIRNVTDHIKEFHPTISESMNIINGNTALYCADCDKYSTYLHYHCYECDTFFNNTETRIEHLKEKHMKWWFEKYCNYGNRCSNFKSGICGFNHYKQDSFIADGGEVPLYVCKYDSPWDELRCKRIVCSYDHFWGHIRSIIKKQNKINKDTQSNLLILNQTCYQCDEI